MTREPGAYAAGLGVLDGIVDDLVLSPKKLITYLTFDLTSILAAAYLPAAATAIAGTICDFRIVLRSPYRAKLRE